MTRQEAIKSKLNSIGNSYEIDENNTRVTISKDNFNWLVYGMDELLSEIEDDKKHIKMMADRIKALESKLLY